MSAATQAGAPRQTAGRFTVFPAIDLRGGRVVRLAQGDPQRQTTYADDPVAVARHWQAEGAEWLHVVNLDGAFGDDGRAGEAGANARALTALLPLGVRLQFGGGLRDPASLTRVLELGVNRAVLGTAALENPALVDWALSEFGPERIAAGIDVRDGQVRLRGWVEATSVMATALAQRLARQGVVWCVFTDVARDGLGTGVNVAATATLARETGLRVIASGGVAAFEDIRRVQAAGLAGVVVGRALYEGPLSLKEVLRNL